MCVVVVAEYIKNDLNANKYICAKILFGSIKYEFGKLTFMLLAINKRSKDKFIIKSTSRNHQHKSQFLLDFSTKSPS